MGEWKTALEKKDLSEVALAQAMLEGVHTVRKEAQECHKKAQLTQKKMEERTSKLISDMFSRTGRTAKK